MTVDDRELPTFLPALEGRTSRLAPIRNFAGEHAELLMAAAFLTLVGWIMPPADRFGYLIALAVGAPWSIVVMRRYLGGPHD
jgi:hypothetical protein